MASKSIMQQGDPRCYMCGKTVELERHHVMAGTANRKLSEQFGLWVWLCHDCHTGTDGAQYNREKGLILKRMAQRAFEARKSHAEWMELFKKNYI